MQPIRCSELRIFLFEGTLKEVDLAVNRWLESTGEMAEVVDINFNYQGPEYDGSKRLTNRGTHGVLLTIRFLSINEVRRRRGYPPLGESEEETNANQD